VIVFIPRLISSSKKVIVFILRCTYCSLANSKKWVVMGRYKIIQDIKDYLSERLDGQPESIIKELNNRLHFKSDYKASYRHSGTRLKQLPIYRNQDTLTKRMLKHIVSYSFYGYRFIYVARGNRNDEQDRFRIKRQNVFDRK